jgi:nucleoside-diphosphate-sugar epimerase
MVRLMTRRPGEVRKRFTAGQRIEIIEGDVQDAPSVAAAASGCGVIVHGVNYPYAEWAGNMPPATRNVIAAARRHGCTVLFPGNVYGIGRQTGRPLTEAVEMQPCSRKGRLRAALETALHDATKDRAMRAIVLRSGDFVGPGVRNPLVDRLYGNAARGKPMEALGRLDVPHQWAFVPDLCRAAVDILDRRTTLKPFETIHFAGHVCDPARSLLDAIAEATGRRDPPVRRLPWWAVRLIGLWDANARELMELRYLWDESVILGGEKLYRLLPDYRDTSLQDAVRLTLKQYETRSGRIDDPAAHPFNESKPEGVIQ